MFEAIPPLRVGSVTLPVRDTDGRLNLFKFNVTFKGKGCDLKMVRLKAVYGIWHTKSKKGVRQKCIFFDIV